jgi:hypothetical protein
MKTKLTAKLRWQNHLFMEKMEKRVLWQYMIYSKHVEHYNRLHKIDVHEEISNNHASARELLSSGSQRLKFIGIQV